MALPKFYKVCQDQQGNIVPQVLGSVFNHGTAVLASLYQDDAGTVPLSNPMTSDAQYGSFKFYVNPGHYDLSFTKPGYTFEPIDDMQVPEDVLTLGTMATQNANAVAITGGTLTGITTLNTTGLNAGGTTTLATLSVSGVSSFTNTLNANTVAITGGTVSLPAASTPGAFTANDAGAGAQIDFRSIVTAGASKYNVLADGMAQNSFTGPVGIGMPTPAYPLDVTGQMRITGSLGLGGSTPGFQTSHVALAIAPSTYGIVTYPTTAADRIALSFRNAGLTEVGSIFVSTTGTAFNTTSDGRLKDDVQALTGSLEAVLALKPVTFRWKATGAAGHGLVAQEVLAVVPEAVTGTPDAADPLSLDYSKFVTHLIGACQTLAAQVEALTARLTALEAGA